jgi:1-acyl-sn-glycerol-3-phosphate acyltransferase
MHQLAYLVALVVGTIWYGSLATVAGWLRRPRTPGSFLDTVGRDWSRLLLRAAGVTVSVHGLEHVPDQGPAIIASNHQSFFDMLAILAHVPRPVKFVAKKELRGVPFFGSAIWAAGHIFIDRQNRARAFATYERAAADMVERRAHLLIYPEGTRSRSGLVLPFKKGPAVVAIASGVAVVPCYCAGTFGILPKGSILVRPRAVQVLFGPAIPSAGLTYDDREAYTERIRRGVLALRAASMDAPADDPATRRV